MHIFYNIICDTIGIKIFNKKGFITMIKFEDKIMKFEDKIMSVVLLSTVPVICNVIIGLILLVLFNSSSPFSNLLVVYTSMGISFCLIPMLILKVVYKDISKEDIGLKRITLREGIIQLTIVIISLGSIFHFKQPDTLDFLVLILQTIAVAYTEEFWARGTLIYSLKKICNNKIIIIISNCLIFTFITHMERPFIENLLYRLPGSFFITIIFMRKQKLNHSFLAHFLLNILAYGY